MFGQRTHLRRGFDHLRPFDYPLKLVELMEEVDFRAKGGDRNLLVVFQICSLPSKRSQRARHSLHASLPPPTKTATPMGLRWRALGACEHPLRLARRRKLKLGRVPMANVVPREAKRGRERLKLTVSDLPLAVAIMSHVFSTKSAAWARRMNSISDIFPIISTALQVPC